MKRPKAKTPKTRKIRIRKAAAKVPACWHKRIDAGGFCSDCGVRAAIMLDLPKPKTMKASVHPFRDISAL